MTDDHDSAACGCIFLFIAIYAIYNGVKWAVNKYDWEPIVTIFSVTVIISAIIYISKKAWEGADSLTEEGKTFIKFGMIWFISFFIFSFFIDWLLAYPGNISQNRGAGIFFVTLFLNMPGTSILFYIGAKKLKSSELGSQITEGRKIIYFGIFWFIFWIITPVILVSYGIVGDDAVGIFLLFVAIPGMIINIIIGRWSSKVNLKKGWEDLNDAQIMLRGQQETFDIEKNRLIKEKEELQKQQKELQKLKKNISKETKEMEIQQKEIQEARDKLEETWNELENTMIKNPFRSFAKEKFHKGVFIEEILELRRTKPGDISSIKTKADKITIDIKEKLKNEITSIEDEYYYDAFLEYFKNVDGDQAEYDRIRIKYNPTIHTQTERRNKEWAEKRRFELSKIEKSMKERSAKEDT